MSLDSPETDKPLAVSALRSKFEQLAAPPSPSRPTASQPHDHNELLSPATTRQRTMSNSEVDSELMVFTDEHHLRSSSSASDLKVNKRPPPPPPRTPKPYSLAPPTSPLLRPTPFTANSAPAATTSTLDKSSLITRKPPPPPTGAPDTNVLPAGGVASLRSKFAPGPSLPSSRQLPSGNRILSHSSAIAPSPASERLTHNHRHSLSSIPAIDPFASLHEFEQPKLPAAPPLPSRKPQRPIDAHSRYPSSETSAILSDSSSSMTSDGEPPTEAFAPTPPSPPRRPVIQPPPRHPPRHAASLPPPNGENPLSSPIDSTSSSLSSTPTLQIPPPLPARRSSPPASTRDLPAPLRPPLPSRPKSFVDSDPHQGSNSAPPVIERKPAGNGSIAPPPTRIIALGDKLPPPRRAASGDGSTSDSADEEETPKGARSIDLLPDESNSSRRPPLLSATAFTHARPHVPAHSGIIIAAGAHVIVAHHHIKIFNYAISDSPLHNIDLKGTNIEWRAKDPRVTSMEFRSADDAAEHGRYLWLGAKDGTLFELDVLKGLIVAIRPAAHGNVVSHIFRHGRSMVTIDENGKTLVFSPEAEGCAAMLERAQPRVVRVTDKLGVAKILGGTLWTSSGPGSGQANGHNASARVSVVRVYDIFSSSTAFKSLQPPEHVGAVTSGTVLQTHPKKVFLGHEGGFISIWDLNTEDGTPVCVEVVKISASDVLCLEGVNDRLWAAGRKGTITAYDVEQKPWVATNYWMAHSGLPVQRIFVDPYSIEKCEQLTVVSVGRDEQARFWDGLLSWGWIDGELLKRESTFSSFRPLNVLIVSWNVDAAKPDALTGSADNANFLDDVLHSVDSPDIIVFGFQELIDLESRKMAAKTMLLGGKKKAADGSISEKVSRSYKMWHDRLVLAVRLAMPPDCPYTVVHAENLVGLFSCIFIKSSERKGLKDVAITTVKRGIAGMYGNKGGIVARLVVDDSSICFINCHLAAGQHHVRSRNADVTAVLGEKEVFPASNAHAEPIAYGGGGDGTMILDHEIVFLNGDLNYRIDQRRDAVISAVHAGQVEQLLPHDQLLKEIKFNRGFRLRSFFEAPITFAPTYKYDRRSSEYDTSEKRRIPAWCDRILCRTRQPSRVRSLHYRRYEANISDHRPISAGFVVTVKSVDHDARSHVKEEVENMWLDQQNVLLSNTRMFYVSQEII